MGTCGRPQAEIDPELLEAFAEDPDLLALVLNVQRDPTTRLSVIADDDPSPGGED